MAVFNDLWWMTLARQEVCPGQCFATLNDFVSESCNSAMWSPIPGDEIEDALPFLLVSTNLPAKHFSPNDFLDMDMWKIVYVDELWFEIWHCSTLNLLIVNDIGFLKNHIHIYPTVSASRNQHQEGIFVGVEIYKHNWRKYLQTIIFSKSYFLVCRGI